MATTSAQPPFARYDWNNKEETWNKISKKKNLKKIFKPEFQRAYIIFSVLFSPLKSLYNIIYVFTTKLWIHLIRSFEFKSRSVFIIRRTSAHYSFRSIAPHSVCVGILFYRIVTWRTFEWEIWNDYFQQTGRSPAHYFKFINRPHTLFMEKSKTFNRFKYFKNYCLTRFLKFLNYF